MNLATVSWTAIIPVTVTGVGVLVALAANVRTLRQNNRLKRAEWFMSTTLQFHKDERLLAMFDAIQYERYSFNSEKGPDSDLGSKKELELVYWLDFLNAISDAVDEKLLTVDHLKSGTLGYAIEMTLANPSVEKYLKHVASYDMNRTSDVVSWGLLRRQYHESFSYLRRMKEQYGAYEHRMKHGGPIRRFFRWLKTF